MKKIAYFDTSHDLPEEIIMAAGFTPYKILGDVHAPLDPANAYLPNFFCPVARSWLAEALVSSSEWAGIAIAQGCHATNRHFDIWKRHVNTEFLHWFNAPAKDDTTAASFFKTELLRLIEALERHYRVSIDSESIRAAIRQSNVIKALLREIAAMRPVKDVSNRKYIELLIDCVRLPKDEVIRRLNAERERCEVLPEFPKNKKRILLTGSDITYPEWMDTLEECNLRVVRDDLSLGERYFVTAIAEDKDPYIALQEYYFAIPKPATKLTLQKRLEYLRTCLGQTKVDGVISQQVKFCEPYAYDSVLISQAIRDAGYKVINLERDYTPTKSTQLLTRLAAFYETL